MDAVGGLDEGVDDLLGAVFVDLVVIDELSLLWGEHAIVLDLVVDGGIEVAD